MELIRKLGTRIINGELKSFGLFKCNFDNKEVIRTLSNGYKQKSCGCIKIKHGGRYTRLYGIWQGIKTRILNTKSKSYKDYGGRGITIYDEWLEFIPFRDWALINGYVDSLTIDRIENDLGYSPENCRWVTKIEQNRNQQKTKLTLKKANEIRELYDTDKYTQRQLAKKYNISFQIVSSVITNRSWENI